MIRLRVWNQPLIILLTLVIFGGTALAATKGDKTVTAKGITISPAIINVDLDQNLLETSFQIKVQNNTDQTLSINLSSLDFKSLNQTGGIAFVGNSGSKYGLANWLILPNSVIVLESRSSKNVTVSIDNRSDLSPGGHYAAVLFNKSSQDTGGNNKVNVNQVAASLVFLKKSGGELYSLNLHQPSFGASWLKLPTQLSLPIENTGNTQTIPRGTVVISGPFNHQVRRGIINPDSAMVLPSSLRLINASLFKVGHAWLPGRYSVTIAYRSADTNVASVVTYNFVYLTPLFVGLALIILVTIVYLYLRNYRSWSPPKKKKQIKRKVIHKKTS